MALQCRLLHGRSCDSSQDSHSRHHFRVTALHCVSEMLNKPNVNPTDDTDDARVLLKCCVVSVVGLFNPNEAMSILCMPVSKLHLTCVTECPMTP